MKRRRSPEFIPRGTGGQKIAAVERREASAPRMRGLRKLVCEGTRGAAQSAFTRVFDTLCACGPASLAREGCRKHPERLSALRSLALREGKQQTSESKCLARTKSMRDVCRRHSGTREARARNPYQSCGVWIAPGAPRNGRTIEPRPPQSIATLERSTMSFGALNSAIRSRCNSSPEVGSICALARSASLGTPDP